VPRRGIELDHRLLLLKRTQGEEVVVGRLHSFHGYRRTGHLYCIRYNRYCITGSVLYTATLFPTLAPFLDLAMALRLETISARDLVNLLAKAA
jgi:hypothetical protein